MSLEDFNEYFLEGQREGGEVYIGDGIALVVYGDGVSLAVDSSANNEIGHYTAFGTTFDLDKDRYNGLRMMRGRKDNRLGIKPELTRNIGQISQNLAIMQEYHDADAMNILIEELEMPSQFYHRDQMSFDFLQVSQSDYSSWERYLDLRKLFVIK